MGGDAMVGFGHKQAWLAVKHAAADAVAGALGVRDLGPVSWRDGIDLAYLTDDRIALTPPLVGARGTWVLAVGRWLMRLEPDMDVVDLSTKLGTEVQFFATYRVAEMHSWARAVDGVLVRDFGYVGETGEIVRWTGDPDAVERAIGLVSQNEQVLVCESDVLRVAKAWSVDPSSLDGRVAPGPLRAAAVLAG